MSDKLKNISNICFVFVVIAALAAIPFMFIYGVLWSLEYWVEALYGIASVLFVVNIGLFLPLMIFKRCRNFSGSAIFISSYVFGLAAWTQGLVLTYFLWGVWGVIIGIVLFGGGVVPFALLATAMDGQWIPFWSLVAAVVTTFGARLIGVLAVKSSGV